MFDESGHSLALLVMVLAAGFLLYTYAGYPMLMYWLQRRGWRLGTNRRTGEQLSRPVAGQDAMSGEPEHDALPPLTIIISAYNAEAHIERKLESMLSLDYPAERLSMLVVSDGSTDLTNTLVNAVSARDPRVRLLSFSVRRGKSACLNDAVAAAGTELLLLTDARQTFDRAAARLLVAHFDDPSVGAVSGSLEIDPAGGDGVVASAGVYWRMEKKLRAAESDVQSAVGVTGAIYALRREAFEPLPEQTILDDVLIPMVAVMNGWRVLFDRRALAFDVSSVSEAQERKRKIRTLAGNFQLAALRPALINPARNPIWWQFVSHKLCRVLAPVAMASFLLASAVLARSGHWFWLLVLAAQVFVHSVSLLPEGQGGLWRTKPMKLLKTVCGFVRLQWFAVLGFIWLWRNRQPQLWETTRHPSPSQETR